MWDSGKFPVAVELFIASADSMLGSHNVSASRVGEASQLVLTQ